MNSRKEHKTGFAGWVRDLSMGVRLAVGGSRTSRTGIARLVLGTIGIGLAVAVLLVAASVGNIADSRDSRKSAQRPDDTVIAGVDPLQMGSTRTSFHGKPISGAFVHPTGPNSPVPPGLDRLPGPGEVVVSPALAELLASPEGELLRPRIPQRIVGTIGQGAVVNPNDLSFYAGTAEVIESDGGEHAVYSFGSHGRSVQVESSLLILLLVGVVALLVPVFIFIATSTRIAGAERDRRLAALRLVGADAHQVRRISAAESLVSAVSGLLLGTGLFIAFRSTVSSFEVFDVSLYPGDVTPSWWLVALIVLLVPVMSVLTAITALRRTVIEPLGVVRMSKPVRRRVWWRLPPFLLGPGLLLLGNSYSGDRGSVLIVIGASLLLLGIPAVLPWLLERVVTRLRGGRPSAQLAIRRLQLDSGTPARVVAGVAVVLAGAIALQTVLAAQAAEYDMNVLEAGARQEVPALLVSVQEGSDPEAVLAPVREVPGVRDVLLRRTINISPTPDAREGGSVTIGDCATMRWLTEVTECSDGDVFLSRGGSSTMRVQPGQTVSIVDYRARGELTEVSKWTVPARARPVTLKDNGYVDSSSQVFATPGAFAGTTLPGSYTYGSIRLDPSVPDGTEHARNALGPLTWRAVATSTGGRELNQNQLTFATIRDGLLAGSVFTLLLAGVSLLVLALEHMRERRRPLAVLAASGVPTGTLARSLLWQNAVPMLLGVVVAVVTGLGLAALVFQLIDNPFVVDWATVGLFSGSAAVLVLLVTALTLPSLRSATRLTALRTE